MDDTNEFDEYFAPVKSKAKPVKQAPEAVDTPKKDATVAPKDNTDDTNEYDEFFNKKGNTLPPAPFWTPEKAVAAVGGVGGALYGAARTPAYSPAFAEWAAKRYGVPIEDVAGYMNMRNPAPPNAQEAARTVAARSSAIPATTPLSTVEEALGHERWLAPRSAVPVPKALSDQMVTMTGGAGTKGSGEEILARHAAGVNKVQAMGHDPFTMERQGSFYIQPEGRARPQPPQVWNRPRAVGPAPWTSTEFAVPKVPSAPAAPTAPASPLPTAAPAANEESLRAALERNIQRAGGIANVAQRGASAGLSAFGGAMGGLQLLDALRSIRSIGYRPDNTMQAAEGAGFVGAMKYPKVGFPVAGTAKMARSARDMYNEGVTPERAASMTSGAGLAAMPRFPIAGLAAQTPEMYFALQKWFAEHPAEREPEYDTMSNPTR